MKKLSLGFIPLLLYLALVLASPVFARIGVGVATGKIEVDQLLYPGTIYELPPLTFLNTGDQTATYRVSTSYHEAQKELRAPLEWFSFRPNDFVLEPNQAQVVSITLQVPVKVEPGKYFAYLEGSPIQVSESGATSIGIAAAAKLYFEIAPANIFVGLYYRLLTFWTTYLPWTNIVAAVVIGLLLIHYAQTHFNFKISKKPRHSEE